MAASWVCTDGVCRARIQADAGCKSNPQPPWNKQSDFSHGLGWGQVGGKGKMIKEGISV